MPNSDDHRWTYLDLLVLSILPDAGARHSLDTLMLDLEPHTRRQVRASLSKIARRGWLEGDDTGYYLNDDGWRGVADVFSRGGTPVPDLPGERGMT